MLEIRKLVLGVCATNCYVVRDETGALYVIDPADDAPAILQEIEKLGGGRYSVLLTHAHFDHILALDGLNPEKVYLHPLEAPALNDPYLNVSAQAGEAAVRSAQTTPVEEGDKVGPFTVLHTPGHRPGAVCFYDEQDGALFSGDTLFASGYGRLDLPEAEPEKMLESIRRLLALPKETRMYPGHGPDTTIGREAEGWRW